MGNNLMRRKETRPAPTLANWGVKTILDEGTVLNGDLKANSSILFKGELNGSLFVKKPTGVAIISSSAKVNGGLIAESIILFGEVNGPIKCRDIRFMKGSTYTGTLQYKNIQMDAGSVVNADSMVCKEFTLDGGVND